MGGGEWHGRGCRVTPAEFGVNLAPAPGLGRLKPDTTGSSHSGRPPIFQPFPSLATSFLGGESSE